MLTNSTVALTPICRGVRVLAFILLLAPGIHINAAEFSCSSGNVTCLIASINQANTLPGQHVINLDPGTYTLQAIDNEQNGLPIIRSALQITAVDDELPTVIERDAAAPVFRIFSVAPGAELILQGITIQRGGSAPNFSLLSDTAIQNLGTTSLYNSAVRDSSGEGGAIGNNGTLNIIRSIIADNDVGHEGGGIRNGTVGSGTESNVLVENSTIIRNFGIGPGGIGNFGGSVRVKDSAIISNSTDGVQPGSGIANFRGSVEIINTTIAKNGAARGGGVYNDQGGFVSIINSTIRENAAITQFGAAGGGITNFGGIVQVKNTVIADNMLSRAAPPSFGPECFGTIASLGNNLIADPSGCDISLKPTDLTGDPGLGKLVEMGEDDQPGKAFYPVLPGSVVINRGDPAACPAKDQLGNPRVGTCDIGAIEFQERAQVPIDVRPRSEANKVNPNSSKDINVAILSENGFDAMTVDSDSVRFGATGIEASPVHVARRDVNGDGQRDLVLRFQIPALGLECGATSATLTGIVNGQGIIGSAPITTTGCKTR